MPQSDATPRSVPTTDRGFACQPIPQFTFRPSSIAWLGPIWPLNRPSRSRWLRRPLSPCSRSVPARARRAFCKPRKRYHFYCCEFGRRARRPHVATHLDGCRRRLADRFTARNPAADGEPRFDFAAARRTWAGRSLRPRGVQRGWSGTCPRSSPRSVDHCQWTHRACQDCCVRGRPSDRRCSRWCDDGIGGIRPRHDALGPRHRFLDSRAGTGSADAPSSLAGTARRSGVRLSHPLLRPIFVTQFVFNAAFSSCCKRSTFPMQSTAWDLMRPVLD